MSTEHTPEYTPGPLLEAARTTPTALWNDSADPDEIRRSIAFGGVGATCNPTIAYTCITKRKDKWLPRIAEIEQEARRKDIDVRRVAQNALDGVSGGVRHQGAAARYAATKTHDEDDLPALVEAAEGRVLLFLCLGLGLMGLTYGPCGTILAEMFPTPVRYTGASLAFNLAGILGASPAPYIATRLASSHGIAAVGGYLSAMAALTLLALLLVPRDAP